MIRGFYTARSGLNAHQEHMNTIANNLANTNTVGYKPLRTAFTDLIYQNINRPEVEPEIMIGHGVKVNKNDAMMAQGPLQPTDYPLDFAILGDNGYFATEDDLGNVYYTRAGAFSLSNEDDTYYLVSNAGDRVLDADGEHIEVEFDEYENLDFDPAVIGVYTFTNPYGLLPVGDNRFIETEISGPSEAMEEPKLRQGYLEGSATEIANEMTKMIEASKAFSFSSRVVQVADEIEQTINSLR